MDHISLHWCFSKLRPDEILSLLQLSETALCGETQGPEVRRTSVTSCAYVTSRWRMLVFLNKTDTVLRGFSVTWDLVKIRGVYQDENVTSWQASGQIWNLRVWESRRILQEIAFDFGVAYSFFAEEILICLDVGMSAALTCGLHVVCLYISHVRVKRVIQVAEDDFSAIVIACSH